MPKFKLNDIVEIHNLIKNTELNGLRGKVCTSFINGRYGVRMDNFSKGKLIKIDNLKPAKNNVNIDITTNLNTKKDTLWCLHPDCLTSLECFSDEIDLSEHMKIH